MNTKTYTYLLANPQKISTENVAGLTSVIEKYPYFQSARALQLKGLKNEHSFLYNDALKVTAAYTTDRDILFEYITSAYFIQNDISQHIKQHDASVHELEIVSEDISAEMSVEIDTQLKKELKKADAVLNPDLFRRKEHVISKKTVESDAPLSFTQKDTHSFSEWLKLSKATPIDRSVSEDKIVSENKEQDEKNRKFELIEKFIQQKPKMAPKDITSPNKNLAAPYTQASDSLMTETLAKVYLQQKNYPKAIQAYKILILKNPEKSGFFADQIRAIKKLINTASP